MREGTNDVSGLQPSDGCPMRTWGFAQAGIGRAFGAECIALILRRGRSLL